VAGGAEMSIVVNQQVGCFHRGPSYRVLYRVEEVVMVLGDVEEVAALCGVSQGAVKHWKKKQVIPWDCREVILQQLRARRYAAPPVMFGPQQINFRSV
jgi:hypothetical protein